MQFLLEYKNVRMTVQKLALDGTETYRVVFSSARKPLVLTLAENADGEFFWTSVPEGRQKEAEGMGAMIDDYLKKNN